MLRPTQLIRPLLPLSLALGAASCASTGAVAGGPGPEAGPPVVAPEDARGFPAFDGESGVALTFDEVVDRAAAAQVIVVGEMHDDAGGHAYQLALVDALFERFPGSVLAMEMLERDEQLVVDDYAAGLVDAGMFASDTGSTSWAGAGSWKAWYQPIIDAALEHEGSVVAANAPRRYVRVASRRGYGPLSVLDPRRRSYFDLPHGPQPDAYRQRFVDLMGGGEGHGGAMDESMVEGIFRGQTVWDATMAGSVAAAAPSDARKVVLLIGQFHSDFDGGTVGQLRHLLPAVELLTVSMQPADRSGLAEGDRGRAGVVVYTD